MKTGPLETKLNTELPKSTPLGLNAGALTLKVEDFLTGAGAEESPLESRTDLGTNVCALAGWKENDDEEKMAGLNVAEGLAFGLNAFALTLSLDREALEE